MKITKVKIFVAPTLLKLEEEINKWTEENDNIKVKSVSFNKRVAIAYITYEIRHLDSSI